jgi:flagellar basal-body rod protein FlgC
VTDAAFDIAAEGMAAERSAMDVIARNLANAGSAGAASNPESNGDSSFVPVSFSNALDDALSSADPIGIDVSFANAMPEMESAEIPTQNSQTLRSDGDPIGQMIALVAAGRAYDADVAALQAAKQMDVEASDIDKF